MLSRNWNIGAQLGRERQGDFEHTVETGPEWMGGIASGSINLQEVENAGILVRRGNLCKGTDGLIYECIPSGIGLIVGQYDEYGEFNPIVVPLPVATVLTGHGRMAMDSNNDYCVLYVTTGWSLASWSSATGTHVTVDEYCTGLTGLGIERLPDGTMFAIATFAESGARVYTRDTAYDWYPHEPIDDWAGYRLQNIWAKDGKIKAGLLVPNGEGSWRWATSTSNSLPVSTSNQETLSATTTLEEINWGGEWNPISLETDVYIGATTGADLTKLWADGALSGFGYEVVGTSTSDAIECWIPDRPCADANENAGWTQYLVSNSSSPYTGLAVAANGYMTWPTVVAPLTMSFIMGWNTPVEPSAVDPVIAVSFGTHSVSLTRGVHYEGSHPIFPVQDIIVSIDGTQVGVIGAGPYIATTGILKLSITVGAVSSGMRSISVTIATSTPATQTFSRSVSASTNRFQLGVACSGVTGYLYGIGTQDDANYEWTGDVTLPLAGFEITAEDNEVVNSVTGIVVGDTLNVTAEDDTMEHTSKSVAGFSINYYATVSAGAEYAKFDLAYDPVGWRHKKETLSATTSLEAITWS